MEEQLTGGSCLLKCTIPSPWDIEGSLEEIGSEMAGEAGKILLSSVSTVASGLDFFACYAECEQDKEDNLIEGMYMCPEKKM